MTDFGLVFAGFTLVDLALAAGRYLILVSSVLLVIKNVTWLVRWGARDQRYLRRARLPLETIFAALLAFVYGRHLYFGGSDVPAAIARLGRAESGLVVWLMSGILIMLLLSRRDDGPHHRSRIQEHHHEHDLQEHHHRHEHQRGSRYDP